MMSDTKPSFSNSLPFLVMISFISVLNILARIIFVPLTPFICKEMNLCHAETGNLFFILSVGFAITLFGSQFLSSRLTHKMTVIFSILSTGFALVLTSYSTTFDFFRTSLFVVGLCSGLFIPSAVSMIREAVHRDHMGKAFGVFATAQSLAFILGPMIVKHGSVLFTWQQILNGFGLCLSLMSVALYFLFKRGNVRGEPLSVSFVRDVFSWPSFWILITLLCLANGLSLGIYNMAPDYFERHSLIQADTVYNLTIIARVISVFAAIAVGIFADRFGLKRSMVISLVFCGAFTALMGTMSPASSLLLFTLQSPMAACLRPLIHFAIATIVVPEKNAAIISISAPFGFIMGAGVLPQVLGFLGDFNLYAQGFFVFGCIAIIAGMAFNHATVYRHVEFSQNKSIVE